MARDGSGELTAGARAQRGVQSLETAGTILQQMAGLQGPVMLRDLADALGVSASQLHPYLVSLRNTGLVEQTERGLYALGPFALDLGLSRLRSLDAYRETIRRVPALVEELQLMVAVSVWGLHGVTIVYVEESRSRIHANVQPGGIFGMTNTATGALFAAIHSPRRTEPVIAAEIAARQGDWSQAWATGETDWRARLTHVAQAGHAVTRDIPIPGVSAVAAPVFDHSGTMKLAVTAIGRTGLVSLDEGDPAICRTLDFVHALSADLGWRGNA